MSHKFAIGQKVDLANRALQIPPRGQYLVSRLMPDPERPNGDPVYRIKSADESHERVVRETDLTASHIASGPGLTRLAPDGCDSAL
jgi:hypothetical protein